MAGRAFHYRWDWTLESSPEQLWPFLADTNRLNYETGAPRVERLATDAEGRRRMRLTVPGRAIEYEEEPSSLEQSVELVFRASPAVRDLETVDYCVGGPGVTPHIVAQQFLAPGERRVLSLPLEPGGPSSTSPRAPTL